LCGITSDCVGIKAKTPEGMDTDNAAIAHAAVLLKLATWITRRSPRTRGKPRLYSTFELIQTPGQFLMFGPRGFYKRLEDTLAGSASSFVSFTDLSGCHCTASTKCPGSVPSSASITPSAESGRQLSQAVPDNIRRLMMRRIHWDFLVLFVDTHDARQLGALLDFDCMRPLDRASGVVVDCRLYVLDERSGAVHIQDLQAVADCQHRLVHVVGILQE
jgi:hypothetical protein